MSFFEQYPITQYNFPNGDLKEIVDYFSQIIPVQNYIDESLDYDFYEVIDGERPDVVSLNIYGTTEFYWTFFIINDTLKEVPFIWSLSYDEFDKYIKETYDDKISICLKPVVELSSEGSYLKTSNTTSVNFSEGDILTGYISGATGILVSKENDMQQLIVKKISGNFIPNELISSNNSSEFVASYKVYPLSEAPYSYIDDEGRIISNPYLFDNEPDTNYSFKSYYDFEYERNSQLSKIKVIKPSAMQNFLKTYKALIDGKF